MTRRILTDKQIAEAQALADKGMACADVAKRMRVSRAQIYAKVRLQRDMRIANAYYPPVFEAPRQQPLEQPHAPRMRELCDPRRSLPE